MYVYIYIHIYILLVKFNVQRFKCKQNHHKTVVSEPEIFVIKFFSRDIREYVL